MLAVLCVCGCPVHVSSTRNREKRLSVCWFQICAILKCHNSIQHAERAIRAFHNLWILTSTIFSFLNLLYIKGWSGKYSLFLELLRCLISKQRILSYYSVHKESSVRYPGASGFCHQSSEFCFSLARRASDVFWGIQITEELWNQFC